MITIILQRDPNLKGVGGEDCGEALLIGNTLFDLQVLAKQPKPVIVVRTIASPPKTIPVLQLSDGQRHTRLLTIAMLAELNVPLVIDQPEDDLDNAFISSSIVGTLRAIKEKRQVIVVTHNANIAVLGDLNLTLAAVPCKRPRQDQRSWIDRYAGHKALRREHLGGRPHASPKGKRYIITKRSEVALAKSAALPRPGCFDAPVQLTLAGSNVVGFLAQASTGRGAKIWSTDKTAGRRAESGSAKHGDFLEHRCRDGVDVLRDDLAAGAADQWLLTARKAVGVWGDGNVNVDLSIGGVRRSPSFR